MEVRWSGRFRWWLFLTGVVMPIVGIASAFFGFKPAVQMWQADAPWIYAALLLTWPTISVMLPLVVPCLLCLGTVCVRPATATNGFVRCGVYMGAGLAAIYFVIAIFCAGWIGVLAGAVFGFGLGCVVLAVHAVARYWHRFTLAQLLSLTTIICVIAATVTYLDWEQSLLEYVAMTAFTAVVATPALNALAYLWASIVLWRSQQKPLRVVPQFTLLLSMVVAWYFSWRAAIDLMLDEYSRLPPKQNCYICSAAAHGHPKFVGAEPISKRLMAVANTQMRRCKFLEICLASASPVVHRFVRQFYDVMGPRLAKICHANVWFADLTYLLLKPLEWLAELLRRTLRIPAEKTRRLY